MTYLLVIYAFLATGEAVQERHSHAAPTMSECLDMAIVARNKLATDYNLRFEDTMAMCILEGNK